MRRRASAAPSARAVSAYAGRAPVLDPQNTQRRFMASCASSARDVLGLDVSLEELRRQGARADALDGALEPERPIRSHVDRELTAWHADAHPAMTAVSNAH